MALQLARLTSLLQNIQVPATIQPRMVQLPLPPKLEGALEPNGLLAQAQKHAFKKVFGPESMVVYKGYVYTGQIDGWIVEINPFGVVRKLARFAFSSCGRRGSREGACGRPMGLRLDSLGFLIVADAYHGIFRVNPKSGRYRQLVNPRLHWVNKRPLGYINDLAVSKDGVIFFTSSSTRWTAAKEINIIFEGENTGRVLFYNPREKRWDKQVQELVVNMSFPNGLQLSEDESYLLVAEGAMSRIHRVWLGPKPPVPDRIELFASNLPGVVDNIRRSPRGTFWVGISQTRHRAMPSVLDVFGRKPQLRGAFITLVNTRVAFRKPRYGMVVELNEDGQVIRSLQDPLGKVYRGVSEVQEENGILFIASPDKTFIGFMKLPSSSSTSSSTGQDDSGTGSTGSPGSNAGSTGSGISGHGSGLPFIQNPRVVAVLKRIQENTMKMTAQRVRHVVMLLVKQLILAKRQTVILRKMAEARERDLQRIKEALRQLQQHGGHGAGSPSTTTSASISTAADSTTASATAEPTTTAPSEVVVTTTASDATTTAAADSTTTAGSGTSPGTTLGSTEATESTTALGAGETTTVADTTSSTEAETTTTDASTSTAAAADTTTTDASAPDTTSTAIPEITTTEELTTSSFGE